MRLTSEDLTVWLLAARQQPDLLLNAVYQFPLCSDHIAGEDDSSEFPAWWHRTCALRIDVVITQPNRIIIIEVKPRGGFSAIGQAAGYAFNYTRKEKPTVPVKPWVVCHAAQPGARDFAESIGVDILEVGWPSGELALPLLSPL